MAFSISQCKKFLIEVVNDEKIEVQKGREDLKEIAPSTNDTTLEETRGTFCSVNVISFYLIIEEEVPEVQGGDYGEKYIPKRCQKCLERKTTEKVKKCIELRKCPRPKTRFYW